MIRVQTIIMPSDMRAGHIQVVEKLLQGPRVDPSARDNEAIGFASRNGNAQIVEKLLQDPRKCRSLYDRTHGKSESLPSCFQIVERLLGNSRNRMDQGIKTKN